MIGSTFIYVPDLSKLQALQSVIRLSPWVSNTLGKVFYGAFYPPAVFVGDPLIKGVKALRIKALSPLNKGGCRRQGGS